VTDEQPDTVSFGPRRGRGVRWTGPGRWARGGWGCGGWIAIVVLGALLAGLGTGLSLLVAHQDATIRNLRTALRKAGRPAPVAAATALPVDSGSALFMVPAAGGGSLSVLAEAVRPRPGSAALTWLYVYDSRAQPGARYGLLEGTCGGQYVTASDLADGTADRQGDLTIVAPNLAISSQAPDVWILVYRWVDGMTIGGIQGPLVGGGAKTFRATPPC
jgi:hypothetical protein